MEPTFREHQLLCWRNKPGAASELIKSSGHLQVETNASLIEARRGCGVEIKADAIGDCLRGRTGISMKRLLPWGCILIRCSFNRAPQ